MAYDDNEFQGQNHQLTGEGCSKVSPVLHPYALPKFDFDDSLQGHLRFDSLIENEVFLGITSQEDNQWIEEYSRGSSGIEFSSSGVESRRNNVWSEATSSESVEMLLKSVGQEEKVLEETIIQEFDTCDDLGSLTEIMDPNLNQDDEKKDLVTHAQEPSSSEPNELLGDFPGFSVSSEPHVGFTSQPQVAQISGGELDSVVIIREKCNEPVLVAKVDDTFDDVIQEGKNLVNESMNKELLEDSSLSKAQNPGFSENHEGLQVQENLQQVSGDGSGLSKDVAAEHNSQIKEDKMDDSMDTDTMIVESSTYEVEKSLHFVPNVESVENPLTETNIPFSEEPTIQIAQGCDSAEPSLGSDLIRSEVDEDLKENIHEESLAVSTNTETFEMQDVKDVNTKSEEPDSLEPTKNSDNDKNDASVVFEGNLPETGGDQVADDVVTKEVLNNDVIIAGNNDSVVYTSHSNDEDMSLPAENSGSIQVDCAVKPSEPDQGESLNEKEDAAVLPLESSDMDIEVAQDLDSQKNVDPSLPTEGSKEDNVTAHNLESDVSVRVEQVSANESESDGSHLLAGNLAISETDEQPKSPIFGVSLVHLDDKEKAEVCEENPQNDISHVESVVASMNPSSLVEKEASNDDLAEKIEHGIDVHSVTLVESCNASQIEQEPSKNTELPEKVGNNSEVGGLPEPKESIVEVNKSNEHDANDIEPDGGSFSSLDKAQAVSPVRVNTTELVENAKDKQEASKDVTNDGAPSSKVTDVENNIQSVSSSNSKQEEKSFTFEVNKSAGKDFQSYPTFQVSDMPKIMETPPKDSNSSQTDGKKLHGDSPSPQILSGMTSKTGVKPKTERKPRRKSAGKENAKKGSQVKETTPVRDSVRVEKSSVSLSSPATGQVLQFEEVKSMERGSTKPGGVLPSLPKLPDLNNSTSMFQQPFTDNQQVQLRAQILVYGSLISGTTPEEPHMIAAFGQSDGGRTWEGVWRACLERLHAQKAQANPATPMQSRSDLKDAGNRSDQGVKHAPIQNKITSSPIGGTPINKNLTPPVISPMIPLSSPLWNIATPSDSVGPTYIPRPSRLDFHQPVSPLHSYQTPPPPQNFTTFNPSWLSQGPFAGQWVAASSIPAFNPSPRFPSLPITESVKLTPPKESGNLAIKHTSSPVILNSTPTIFPEASSVLSSMKKTPASSDQISTDSKVRKRKKNTPLATVSAPIPLFPQGQTDSVTAPVVSSPFSTSVVVSKSTPPKFLSPVLPTHHNNRGGGDQKVDKVVVLDENLSNVEESKRQAEHAAKHAAAAVDHCHGVWGQLERQSKSGLSSDDEAKLVSSAVSIAAAASVAKVAAAAAKIASGVAEQASLMVNVMSNRSGNLDQNKFDKSAADSSRHAENVNLIVKAAAMAAEAVAQAGKIVGMSEPFPLRDLIEAGPEGYWKTPLNVGDKKDAETAPEVSDKANSSVKSGLLRKDESRDLGKNQTMEVDGALVPFISHEKDKRKPRVRKSLEMFKTVAVAPESEIGLVDTSKVDSPILKENNIKEGCFVEVYKNDDKYGGAWFGANVLGLKDGKALVCYTEIQSDDGQLKEWVPLETQGTQVPKIRAAHPVTTMRLEGNKKRNRTALTEFVWSTGDRVDVWTQDRWREGIVKETNKIDLTSLTVQFPGQGETSVVRTWSVRPTLVWKDGKWIDCHTSERRLSSQLQGDSPKEKRMKLGSPVLQSKKSDRSSESVDLVDSRKPEESRTLPLSANESSFNIGSTRDEKKKVGAQRTIRSGIQKEGPRVIFGIPKPGKKQKFMDVSRHYVGDGSNKNKPTNDSVKFTRYLIPQAPTGSRGWKNTSRNDANEKQISDTKTIRSRKPPVPSRAILSSKSTMLVNKAGPGNKMGSHSNESQSDHENQSDNENQMEFPSFSKSEDAAGRGDVVSKLEETSKGLSTSTSSNKSDRGQKRKFAPVGGKVDKVEKPVPEPLEPRRSNRKIQPTSRLLEGLQSSMTISKLPSFSHSKVTPKGNSKNG